MLLPCAPAVCILPLSAVVATACCVSQKTLSPASVITSHGSDKGHDEEIGPANCNLAHSSRFSIVHAKLLARKT